MHPRVVVASPGETAQEAAKIMTKNHIGALVVVGENDEVLGLITEGTIIEKVVAKGKSLDTRLDDIMIHNPYTIHPDRTLQEAADFMRKKGVKRLPVVEDEAIVGMITATDLIAYEEELAGKLAELLLAERKEFEKSEIVGVSS